MGEYLLVQGLNGLVIGVIYAVIAAGLTIIFSILKIVNFAHGEMFMAGGYFAYFSIALLGLPPLLGIPAAMILSFALALLIERSLLTPLYDARTERKGDYGVLATFGISILLRNLALLVFGAYPLRPPSFWNGSLIVGQFYMTWDRIFAAGFGIALLGLLVWFMYRTPWGEALNAVGQSRESAAIVGIDSTRFYRLAFGLGGALAGAAGALVGPIYSLSPSMGLAPDTQAFAIVILGGMGSVPGAILAGLLIGLCESMFVALFPDPSRALTYAQAFSLVVLMAVLLFRPTGFFGRTHMAME
jgi:branched-chain amino acid transport system permease protein